MPKSRFPFDHADSEFIEVNCDAVAMTEPVLHAMCHGVGPQPTLPYTHVQMPPVVIADQVTPWLELVQSPAPGAAAYSTADENGDMCTVVGLGTADTNVHVDPASTLSSSGKEPPEAAAMTCPSEDTATLDQDILVKRDDHVAPASVLTHREPCDCARSCERPSAETALDAHDTA